MSGSIGVSAGVGIGDFLLMDIWLLVKNILEKNMKNKEAKKNLKYLLTKCIFDLPKTSTDISVDGDVDSEHTFYVDVVYFMIKIKNMLIIINGIEML